MTLNLEEAMRIKITRKTPDYAISLLSAWLSEGAHGITYTGDVSAYLTQVAEKYALPLPKLDEIDSEWVEKLNRSKSLELLLALFATRSNAFYSPNKYDSRNVFDAYLKLNLIQHRQVFSPEANPIKEVVVHACFDDPNLLSAFLLAYHGYKVTLVHDGLAYSDLIDWVFKLVFPQVIIKKSAYVVDEIGEGDNTKELILDNTYEYSTSALISGYDFGLNAHFSYIIKDDSFFLSGGKSSELIELRMTNDKKCYIKHEILADQCQHDDNHVLYQIVALDYEHPSTEVFMSNLVNYENTAGEMASFTELLTDEDYTTKVSTTEIIANKYNFSVSYYAKDTRAKTWLKSLKQFDVVDLSDVVTFHRPPTIKALKDEAESEIFYEIALSDINEFSRIDHPKKEVLVNASDALRTKNEGLEKGDILFAIKGDIGKVALVQTVDNRLMGKAFIGLRLKPKYLLQGMTPEYLVAYLADDNVKNYIRYLNTGAKVENIRMDDLKSIPVIIDKRFIEKTKFAVDALEAQHKEINYQLRIYDELKNGLSTSISGKNIYINEVPKRINDKWDI